MSQRASSKRKSLSGSRRTKLPRLWPPFTGYEFKCDVDCFEVTELHQALLDATTSAKALESIEGMLAHSLDPNTTAHIANFVVKTPDIIDCLATIVRRFPATQLPFAIVLHTFSFMKDVVPLVAAAKGMPFRKLIRCVPASDVIVMALLSILRAVPPAAQAFALIGGDTLLLEVLNVASSDPSLRALLAGTAVGILMPMQPKDPAQRSALFQQAVKLLGSAPAAELMAQSSNVEGSLAAVLDVLQMVSNPVANDRVSVLPPADPASAQLVVVGLTQVALLSPKYCNHVPQLLEVLYKQSPSKALLKSEVLKGAVAAMVNPCNEVASTRELRRLMLYVAARLVQGGFYDQSIVHIASDVLADADGHPQERTVALQLMLALLSNPLTGEAVDGRLTAEKIEPGFKLDTAPPPPALAGTVNQLRHRWICFIHVYTHAVSLTFSALFAPLAKHVQRGMITVDQFKRITKWDHSPEDDAILIERIVGVRERQVAVTGREADTREELVDAEHSERAHIVETCERGLAKLRSDPEYVAWLKLREDALEDHSAICSDRLAALDRLAADVSASALGEERRLREASERQSASIQQAHTAELAGIVWDPDELASKKAVLSARMTKVTKQTERNIAELRTVSSWREDVLGVMRQTLTEYNNQQLANVALLVVEKEEERIRGQGIISTPQWCADNAQSILEREARARMVIEVAGAATADAKVSLLDGIMPVPEHGDDSSDEDDDALAIQTSLIQSLVVPPSFRTPALSPQRTSGDTPQGLSAPDSHTAPPNPLNDTQAAAPHPTWITFSDSGPEGPRAAPQGGADAAAARRRPSLGLGARLKRHKSKMALQGQLTSVVEPLWRLEVQVDEFFVRAARDFEEELLYMRQMFDVVRAQKLRVLHPSKTASTSDGQLMISTANKSTGELAALNPFAEPEESGESNSPDFKAIVIVPNLGGFGADADNTDADSASSKTESQMSASHGPPIRTSTVARRRSSTRGLGNQVSPHSRRSSRSAITDVEAYPLTPHVTTIAFLPTEAMLEARHQLNLAYDASLQKIVAAEWQWRAYIFDQVENAQRRRVMLEAYRFTQCMYVELAQGKFRAALRGSEQQWRRYVWQQMHVERRSLAVHREAPGAQVPPVASDAGTVADRGGDDTASVTTASSVGGPAVTQQQEAIRAMTKELRSRGKRFVTQHAEMLDSFRGDWEFGKARISVVDSEAAERAALLAQLTASFDEVYTASRTALMRDGLMFMLIEAERSGRGQVMLEERILTYQLIADRPRGKRYRPPREEPIYEEKPRLEGSTLNRIRAWQREIVVSDLPAIVPVEDPVCPTPLPFSAASTATTTVMTPTASPGAPPTVASPAEVRRAETPPGAGTLIAVQPASPVGSSVSPSASPRMPAAAVQPGALGVSTTSEEARSNATTDGRGSDAKRPLTTLAIGVAPPGHLLQSTVTAGPDMMFSTGTAYGHDTVRSFMASNTGPEQQPGGAEREIDRNASVVNDVAVAYLQALDSYDEMRSKLETREREAHVDAHRYLLIVGMDRSDHEP